MTHYAIEMQRCRRWRWAWAICVPNTSGYPSLLHVEYDFHPFSTVATKLIGGADYNRVEYGWATTQERAERKARRAIARRQEHEVSAAASAATHTIREARP